MRWFSAVYDLSWKIARYQSIKMIEITGGNKTTLENANCKIVENISGNDTVCIAKKITTNICKMLEKKQQKRFRLSLFVRSCECEYVSVHGRFRFRLFCVYFLRQLQSPLPLVTYCKIHKWIELAVCLYTKLCVIQQQQQQQQYIRGFLVYIPFSPVAYKHSFYPTKYPNQFDHISFFFYFLSTYTWSESKRRLTAEAIEREKKQRNEQHKQMGIFQCGFPKKS